MGVLQTPPHPFTADGYCRYDHRRDTFLFPGLRNVPADSRNTGLENAAGDAGGVYHAAVAVSWDIRGWTEMHPLDGPAWSLYFEYIANILYAVIVRRFSKTLLAIFVFLSACFLVQYLVTSAQGDVIGGWALDTTQQHIGFARMLYPVFCRCIAVSHG